MPDDFVAERGTEIHVEARNLSRFFDVSAPLLNRVVEGKPRQIVRAVDDVSFTVKRGTTFSLVGESGCGKSTVARLMVGLYEPTAGSIVYDGIDLATLHGRAARAVQGRMQMVFQDPYASLNPRWRVADIVAEPIRLINGVARVVLPRASMEDLAVPVLILSIGLSGWVNFARTVRGSTMVEKGKEYVLAARVIGRPTSFIMLRHVLPNVTGPILVIATISLAVAILAEATLSFLGVGVPPTQSSLGTLVNVGNNFLFSGEWWMVIFPGATLAILVLAVNLLGDWLRDALNPRLQLI
ncbi:MAG: ATP-binding cassette domain-containing protein [Proteobacteria bacterium]|nr:ATP-binding cassette domain-containing protein [Pseudomonadota bacterium]